ncbi:hypothetical protein DKP91_18150, partial [Enterococcus faecium]
PAAIRNARPGQRDRAAYFPGDAVHAGGPAGVRRDCPAGGAAGRFAAALARGAGLAEPRGGGGFHGGGAQAGVFRAGLIRFRKNVAVRRRVNQHGCARFVSP